VPFRFGRNACVPFYGTHLQIRPELVNSLCSPTTQLNTKTAQKRPFLKARLDVGFLARNVCGSGRQLVFGSFVLRIGRVPAITLHVMYGI
jgi:hypothetical protein